MSGERTGAAGAREEGVAGDVELQAAGRLPQMEPQVAAFAGLDHDMFDKMFEHLQCRCVATE
jgi:hypothetical protein